MADGVVGRLREWTLLTDLLTAARDENWSIGQGPERRLVVRGPAGIGKTHLLNAATAEARGRGFRVRRCGGHQRERDAPLAALEELLGPDLTESHAELASGGHDGQLSAAMQALRIIFSWAQAGPVLLVIDDAQWIDQASWESLLFVLRRLTDDPVVVLVAVTSGSAGDERLADAALPTVTLAPLPDDDAARLLYRTVPDLPDEVATVVLRESAGLPLALVELGVAAGRDGREVLTGTLPVSDRLEQAYVRALSSLPGPASQLLRILSVGESRSAAELLAAATHYLGHEAVLADLQPALAARLVEASADGFDVWFASPTARAVVSALTPVAERHRIHLGWAEALTVDPDRALWHRAAGTLGPDSRVEADLLALASRALNRTDMQVASAATEQAARFADDPQRAAHLMLRAAHYALDVDDAERCRRLIDAVNPHALATVDRASMRWLTSMLRPGWSGADTLDEFIDSARQMHEGGADRLALDALMGVCLRFHFTDPPAATRERALQVLEDLDLPAELEPYRIGGRGVIAATSRGRVVLEQMARTPAAEVADAESLLTLGLAAIAIGAPTGCREYLTAAESRCRTSGRLGTLARVLITLAFANGLIGHTGQARSYGTEGRRLAEETGQRRWVATGDLALGYVAALRGDGAAALRLADGVESTLSAVGLFPLISHVDITRGIVAASVGDHARAVEHLARPFRRDAASFHPQVRFWGLTHLAFAAVRAGAGDVLDLAVSAARVEQERVPAPLLTTGLAFVDATIAPDAEAGAAFERALALAPTDWPFERARLLLGYGSWLRRHQRPVEARLRLNAAAASFATLGTRPWAQSAQRELRAAGGPKGPTGSVADVLSPQELQVAELVSEGLTNRQVAERLFVSPRTVESHLYRIYAKVGAANRTDLARIVGLPASTG